MGEVVERLFPSMAALAPVLAAEIAERLAAAVKARGVASLVATGGATPGPLYDVLSDLDLPWERVFVTLSDERWVSVENAASNQRLVRERLMRGRAAGARLNGLTTADPTPALAEPALEAVIEALPRPFDVVVLGMGGDGHVASLFPGNPATLRAMDMNAPALVAAAESQGAAGADQRLSLTFRALRETAWTAILITGDEKLALARRARTGDDVAELPVRGVLTGPAGPVEIWWSEQS